MSFPKAVLEEVGRTVMAQIFFEDCAAFRDGKLAVESTEYAEISRETENFSTRPIASMGSSSTREVILLNPRSSPILREKYRDLERALSSAEWLKRSPLTEEEVVKITFQFVQDHIFNRNPADLDRFIAEKRRSPAFQKVRVGDQEVTCIPIDEFVQAGLGVCRHHALVTAYLLHRLTCGEHPRLTGAVQHIRDSVSGAVGRGAHVWVTYVNHKQRMHIDTLWKQCVPNFDEEASERGLKRLYGSTAIDHQKARTEPFFRKCQRIFSERAALEDRKRRLEEAQRLEDILRLLKNVHLPVARPAEEVILKKEEVLHPRALSRLAPSSFRSQFFERFNVRMMAAGVSQPEYDRLADTLEKAIFTSEPPIRARIEDFLSSVYEKMMAPYAGLPHDKRPKEAQILRDLFHREAWFLVYESSTESLVWKTPKNSPVLRQLHQIITELKGGYLNRETFDSLPKIIKNAIYGKTYAVEVAAGRPTYSDHEFGKHAFLGEGREVSHTTRTQAIQLYLCEVIRDLFEAGQTEIAMEAFIQLDVSFRNQFIYGAMWEVCGKPSGDRHFGAKAFHGEKPAWQGKALLEKQIQALTLALSRFKA